MNVGPGIHGAIGNLPIERRAQYAITNLQGGAFQSRSGGQELGLLAGAVGLLSFDLIGRGKTASLQFGDTSCFVRQSDLLGLNGLGLHRDALAGGRGISAIESSNNLPALDPVTRPHQHRSDVRRGELRPDLCLDPWQKGAHILVRRSENRWARFHGSHPHGKGRQCDLVHVCAGAGNHEKA